MLLVTLKSNVLFSFLDNRLKIGIQESQVVKFFLIDIIS